MKQSNPKESAYRTRERILLALRSYLSRERMPRLVMFVVLLLTAAAGFFCSRLLLGAGLDKMGVRYCIAALAAWIVLMAFIRTWVEFERRRFKSPEDVAHLIENQGRDHVDESWKRAGRVTGDLIGNTPDVPFDDDGCVILIVTLFVVFLVTGIVGGIFSLVIGAPSLLAEVFLDVVVARYLTRGLRAHDAQWWASGVILRTWKLALALSVLLLTIGSAIQAWRPEVRSIGDLFR